MNAVGSAPADAELALSLIRVTVGAVMLAHGWNHFFGGGRLPGAARWFESLGMRPGIVHAWLASATEVGAGAGLVLGFATVLACAATVGLMTVAGVVAHRRNGFFVFRDGYEYVLVLALAAVAVALGGPGRGLGQRRRYRSDRGRRAPRVRRRGCGQRRGAPGLLLPASGRLTLTPAGAGAVSARSQTARSR